MEKQNNPDGPPPAYYDRDGTGAAAANQPPPVDGLKGQPPQGYQGYPPAQQGYAPAQPGYPSGQPGYPPGQQPIQTQPGGYYQQPYGYAPVVMAAPHPQYLGPPPENHSALAWLTCLFCCWPLGLVAIIKSMEVNSATAQGDINRARVASESARKFGYASLGFGIVLNILAVVMMVVYFSILLPNISNSRY